MTDIELLELAEKENFKAAIVPTEDIIVNYGFRKFCEENLCGKYGQNYSCPPDCGTPQEVHAKLLSKNTALVLQKVCDIKGYEDRETVMAARKALNYSVLKVVDEMCTDGYSVIPLGYSGCPHCNPCKRSLNQPCSLPHRQISCLSAYCIDVAQLAERCNLQFTWSENKLYLFGMILFDR